MASISNFLRYVGSKFEYSVSLCQKTHGRVDAKSFDTIMKTLLVGKLTFLYQNKGEKVAPTIGTQGGTFLVRRIPDADPTNVYVGDLVVLKDPMNSDKYLVRRLAAIEGYEMASTDEKDEPFVLEDNECWVLAEDKDLKPKRHECSSRSQSIKALLCECLEAREGEDKTQLCYYCTYPMPASRDWCLHSILSICWIIFLWQDSHDSRTFGPVAIKDIVGRAIYCLKNDVDHGPVDNSNLSVSQDSPVLAMELDVDELKKNHKQ